MRPIRPGDHLRVSRGLYAHDCIFEGDGQVIHFSGFESGKSQGRIRRDPIAAFVGSADRIEVIEYGWCFPDDQVVHHAVSKLGEGEYNLIFRNCQHFARWCKTGEHSSDQVERAITVAAGASVARLASSLAVATALAAAAESASGAAAVMSGLVGIGGSAVGGVAVVAAAPAVVATVATHRALRDDPLLPAPEREARRDGRRASTAAAAGGTGLSLALLWGAGVPGFGAAGVTSGLAALGGSMLGGLFVVGLIPVAAAAGVGALVYKARRRR